MKQPLVPPALSKIDLSKFDPAHVWGEWNKKTAGDQIKANTPALRDLAYRLYAEDKRAVLLVLQGMDASGKDGTIRTVMTGVNPQSCQITSFKVPTSEELDHDFLWRIHKAVPRRGEIGIFNRSHYEDVVVVRVHKLVPREVWQARYDQINAFEEILVDSGVTLIKCFLHINKETQRERLQARLDDPTKRWKFQLGDLNERKLWDEYQQAYEDALTKCNTKHAPWHIVPADKKWNRNLTVSQLLLETLQKMAPDFPPAAAGLDGVVVE
jgi:PPK2 family polyphosphate:nucleotide phosphotransferase